MRLLSKGELCVKLGLFSARSGRKYYKTLNTHYFTDEVLLQIGMTRDRYRRTRVFNADQTTKIKGIFKIGETQTNK